jgi:hypothetical protein
MSLHFSPGSSSASFVELVGNSAVLSGTKLSRDAADIFVHQGAFPIDCLPAALHESTHHYCFSMPVGQALSACFLEAVRTNLAGPCSDERDDHLAEALIRYDLVTEAMRPIAEGIALYAEFDASPGDSRSSISPPLSDALALFSRSLPDDFLRNESVGRATDFLLFKARLTGSTTARRETLLSRPLLDDDDGYLTGYWLAKNWRLHLIDRLGSDALLDTDFYLQFIANFFYGDLTLANMILDFDNYGVRNLNGLEEGQEDFVNAFLIHFQKRLRHLLLGIEGSDVDRLETALSSTSGYSFDDVQIVVPGDPVATFDGHAKAVQGLGQKFVEIQRGGIGAKMVHLLNGRDWLAYASFETSVRVNEYNRFILGEGENDADESIPVVAGPVLTVGLETGQGTGVIELLRHRTGGPAEMHRLIWRGLERVAVLTDLAALSNPTVQRAAQLLADPSLPQYSSATVRQMVKGLTDSVRAEMNGMTAAPIVAEDCRTQLMQIRGDIFAGHLAVFVRKDGQPPSDSQLREPLPMLCGNSTAALRVAAAAGFHRGGMLPTPSDFFSPEEENALLTCSVELAVRRGNLICFRV